MKPIRRVIVVDDNPTFLKVAARLMRSLPHIEMVAEATSGAEAIKLAAELHPDLVLMDLEMPEMDGLEATRSLHTRPTPPAVFLMSVHDVSLYRNAATAAGAVRFLAKSDLVTELGIAVAALAASRDE